jgi:hypothetical protein
VYSDAFWPPIPIHPSHNNRKWIAALISDFPFVLFEKIMASAGQEGRLIGLKKVLFLAFW